uniref:Contactin associated protein like 3 n=1 Tax=Salarias fasciatus TaxID=181472 RepID=A0A672IV76_SALFA
RHYRVTFTAVVTLVGLKIFVTVPCAGAGGWSPLISDRYQWLEVDLGRRTQITAVATQGRYGSSDWLTAYLLMFSDTGHNWRQHRQEDSLGAFPGNSNADTVVQYKLQQPVIARYLRLIPLDWNPTGRIGLRLEIYGCRYTSDVASFDGSSSLVYRVNRRPSWTAMEVISLKFKTLRNSGTLFHAEGQRDHSLSLVLEKGKLLLYHQQGRMNECEFQFLVQLSVAAVRSHGLQKPILPNRNFHGCLENLLYGDLKLISLAKQNNPQVTVLVSCTLCFNMFKKHRHDNLSLKCAYMLPGSSLNDGQWHSVELHFSQDHLSITVDKDEGATAHTSPSNKFLFPFSGCPSQGSSKECRNPFKVFQGCMRLLTLDGQLVDLIKVQQRLLGNYSDLQIDMCGIVDRCSPSLCEHGGRCTQSWSTFHCNCSSSGYRGATCHSSMYEKSYVDGSGPIRPQLIYCNMTEGSTWMVIQHNNTEFTTVQSSPEINQHVAHFDYSSEEPLLAAIIRQSEHCEQELSYHCRKSRLFNTHEGTPFSWWVGGLGEGQIQTYWGGALPDSRQCSCGLQDNCLDSSHYCNCDADFDQWTDDSGLLTLKETLPVRSLVLGDLQRPGSQAAYRVGPLRCHGDKNFWNAAFFDKETSYLHFPTFHGELNADISFLFKTTSSSGVFLENLGIKDFIRIELSSSSEVVFSFDVGNGPLEVRVQTSVPLNDDRWHSVRAERNVKEALLRVDDFPTATQEAPVDGLVHLQLNSQLFIGGTASRQKGFLGCIRSLQLNGVTLDLEERAKITPGVRPGCPGHCSSYGSLCQNEGRCVEKTNGFSCDCGQSAFTGAFCHQEVSATFQSMTSITYILKEPYELSRNASALPSYIYTDITLRGESISLSFRTSQSPALLLHLFYSIPLRHITTCFCVFVGEDELELRYKLHSRRDVEVLSSRVMNLADRRLHTVIIRRLADSVSIQVKTQQIFYGVTQINICFNHKQAKFPSLAETSDGLDSELAEFASLGFTGCLSGVRFNSISPLKAALLHPDSPVTVTGPLLQSSCGFSSSENPYAAETTHSLSDQPGSVDPRQPLVNAIKSDSALIGGNAIHLSGSFSLNVPFTSQKTSCSLSIRLPQMSTGFLLLFLCVSHLHIFPCFFSTILVNYF